MRKFLKEYFSFSRSELRIIVILSGLILISFLIRFFIPIPDFQNFKLTEEDNNAIDSFINSLERISYEKKETFVFPGEKVLQPACRDFNPNIVSPGELEEMGFPGFIAKNLLRYRKAGGKFHQKSDIKKIYGFSDSLYDEWEEYIVIPQSGKSDVSSTSTSASASTSTYTFTNTVLELNSTDSISLLSIGGIGPYFAGKIVNYRDRLGGFLSIQQLLEINGMDTIRLENFRNQIKIDSLQLVKINLNTATLKDLKRHPYISHRLAESLMKYKQFTGSIKSLNELLENRLLTENEFEKLKPYIKLNE